ncbi:hypothetical protein F8568_043850 [Actinomadura sp. LD22]|uniref:Alpha/beta hydrolase n=1 Tax=Actinomadura physcomitrii TaxID=2650748 RepID=A0A6I4MLS9_9ACTN|nr:lipase family protein [Actinomadura physcomitrii]MWA07158.1 hypothetical protein [Actinomadura physcomitrii]
MHAGPGAGRRARDLRRRRLDARLDPPRLHGPGDGGRQGGRRDRPPERHVRRRHRPGHRERHRRPRPRPRHRRPQGVGVPARHGGRRVRPARRDHRQAGRRRAHRRLRAGRAGDVGQGARAPGRRRRPVPRDCTLELLLDYQGKKVADYFTTNPLGTEPWADRVTENRLGGTPIKVPVLQYHSDADEIVAFNQADTLHRQYCAAGVPLTWKVWNGLSHITLVYRGNADAMAFIADRLAGKPAASNCATTPSS